MEFALGARSGFSEQGVAHRSAGGLPTFDGFVDDDGRVGDDYP